LTVTVTEVGVTVTLNDPDAELPALSVAEQSTVVVPTGKVEPEAGVQVTGTEPSTASVAEAVNVTTAPLELVACTVIFDGSVKVGGVLSTTVTVKLPDALLPALSVAEQETVVVPSGNVEPDPGVQENVLRPDSESEALAA
jgi:hypothetical protein